MDGQMDRQTEKLIRGGWVTTFLQVNLEEPDKVTVSLSLVYLVE
jgi:hypothetical protein